MNKILILVSILAIGRPILATEKITFTNINSEKILQLETDIAYFFGAPQTQLIAQHYMQAIKAFENNNTKFNKETLRQLMLPFLQNAYAEIKKQTSLNFDAKRAATYEFDLIYAQSEKATFESCCDILINLYKEVFQSNNPAVQKAAMLRTFLYQYKIQLLSADSKLSDHDINFLKSVAKQSEAELSMLNKK